MVKFKPWRKKTVTSGFGCSADYVKLVGHCHTGIDWSNGYGTPVRADSAGYVYKVFKPWQLASNWTAVYYLTPHTDGTVVESVYGHLSRVDVKEGDIIKEDQIIGLEGNYGQVYAGGVEITPEMQRNGNRKGHHVHEMRRPTYRTRVWHKDTHYLLDRNGEPYRDKEGLLYQIIHNDNNTKGAVNPLNYKVTPVSEKLLLIARWLKLNKDPDYDVFMEATELVRKLGN